MHRSTRTSCDPSPECAEIGIEVGVKSCLCVLSGMSPLILVLFCFVGWVDLCVCVCCVALQSLYVALPGLDFAVPSSFCLSTTKIVCWDDIVCHNT